jgi:hypothetical protein
MSGHGPARGAFIALSADYADLKCRPPAGRATAGSKIARHDTNSPLLHSVKSKLLNLLEWGSVLLSGYSDIFTGLHGFDGYPTAAADLMHSINDRSSDNSQKEMAKQGMPASPLCAIGP